MIPGFGSRGSQSEREREREREKERERKRERERERERERSPKTLEAIGFDRLHRDTVLVHLSSVTVSPDVLPNSFQR